jgi:hypothetical protein
MRMIPLRIQCITFGTRWEVQLWDSGIFGGDEDDLWS